MTQFLRLLADIDKASALATACKHLRMSEKDPRCFEVAAESFNALPGKPFAYWVSDAVRGVFQSQSAFEQGQRTARQGLATAEDFRFVRAWWETQGGGWFAFAKGGAYSPFYADVYLVVKWKLDGAEIKAGICRRYPYLNGNAEFVAKNTQFYFRPGLTWSLRSQIGMGVRVMPNGCIFGHKGPAAFEQEDDYESLLALLSIANSAAFSLLVSLQISFGSYEVGVIQKTPIPEFDADSLEKLADLSRKSWSLKYGRDTTEETSHAFLLPAVISLRSKEIDLSSAGSELARIQAEIDEIAFRLYGFSEADRAAALGLSVSDETVESADTEDTEDGDDEHGDDTLDLEDGLLSWSVGVAFGRFDWRLATGEREAPPEPDPFDPLPAKSPGMLPDGAAPFHDHSGILVDDQGHPHDLPRLIEEVLTRVQTDVPADVRRWLQRDFFPLHLKQYSKSRRKAPVYWPLSTTSGSYTLWLYYPSLTSQTLYTAVNDFVEPKLKQVSRDAATLRDKGAARIRDDEKAFEALQALELELIELRDALLGIAPTYRPNHDDGVQITAAPLWPLFRHKPWQKVLKDTWAKLEKGDYDWAHLAMSYWPDRVREKCKTDKSLAIAHDLKDLYEPTPSTEGGKKKKKGSGA